MDANILIIIAEVAGGAVLASLATVAVLRPKLQQAIESQRDMKRELDAIQLDLENAKKEVELRAKEEAIQMRDLFESEARQKRESLERQEEKLDARRERLESREEALSEATRNLSLREQELQAKLERAELELQRISGMDRESARKAYLERVEHDFREIGARRAREIESEATYEAERKAKKILLDVMERNHVDYVTEATVSVVNLPSEDMKGRIIGRDGRNIRSFEQVAGVDLIIDDTPEAVVIACFDPVRRETARLALMNLMVDGRIHPGRIEELYERAQAEVQRTISEAGDRAIERAGVAVLPHPVVEMMGHLRFRTSYGQNVLDHSVEVANLASMLAAELGCHVDVARTAGFLHDIGKALGPEWDGPHALTGMEYLKQQGIRAPVLHAVGAHHHEIAPETPEATIVMIADSLSAARPGARRENLDHFIKRLSGLESLAASFPGVERAFALQAGREVRLIVRPEQVDDLQAAQLAADVAKRIESEMEYPGQVKVTVIRESRFQEIAK